MPRRGLATAPDGEKVAPGTLPVVRTRAGAGLKRGDHDDLGACRTECCSRVTPGSGGTTLMHGPKLHLHSMLVPYVLAFVLLA